jgi:phage gp46-like protein
MTDVLLQQTNDGGEITYVNGNPITTDGLEVAVYLSLYGGNKNDDGTDATAHLQYWANFDETVPEKRYRSEFQALSQGLSNVAANLLRLEEAAKRDLQWLLDTGIATAIEVSASVPAVKTLQLDVTIDVTEETSVTFTFTSAVTT